MEDYNKMLAMLKIVAIRLSESEDEGDLMLCVEVQKTIDEVLKNK